MDNLYKSGLNQDQQEVIDTLELRLDHHKILPECLHVSLMCNDVIERMFLQVDEIEEIEVGNKELIGITSLRKLYSFRYYFGEELVQVEKNMTEHEIGKTLKLLTIEDILEFFKEAEYTDFKNYTRKFSVYFLAVENWYETETGKPLGFQGLSEPKEYNDYLGF